MKTNVLFPLWLRIKYLSGRLSYIYIYMIFLMCCFSVKQTLANCNCPQGSTSIGTTGVTTTISNFYYTNEVLCIKGKLNIQNINLNECIIYMDDDAEIEVFQHASMLSNEFYPCSGNFYKGIKVSNAVSCLIYDCKFFDAFNGIRITGCQRASNISFCTFDRNYIGILLDNETKVSINSNHFVCNGVLLESVLLDLGNAEKTRYGILGQNKSRVEATGNVFIGLHEGIRIIKSTGFIQDNTFRYLHIFNFSPSRYQQQDGGYAISLIDALTESISNNTITNAYVGIYSIQSALKGVNLNQMDSLDTGIFENLSVSNSEIFENTIKFTRFGINVQSPIAGIGPHIYDNEIETSRSHQNLLDRRGIVLFNIMSAGGIINNSNIIRIDHSCYGISLINCSGQIIEGNIILYSKPRPFDQVIPSYGIGIQRGSKNYIIGNRIESSYSGQPIVNALQVNQSQDNSICCNYVVTATTCYSVNGGCDHSKWIGNSSSGNYTAGLKINSGAFFGPQPETFGTTTALGARNRWSGNGTTHAFNDNGQGGITDRSVIHAKDCTSPNWPLVISPNQSCPSTANAWIRSATNEISGNCYAISQCDIPNYPYRDLPDDYISMTDFDIAVGALDTFENGTILQWDGAKQLYNRLETFPDLINTDTVFSDFYNFHHSGLLAKLVDIDLILKNQMKMDSLNSHQHHLNLDTLSEYGSIIHSLAQDLTLAQNTQDSLDILDEIDLITQQWESVFTLIEDNLEAYYLKLDTIKSIIQNALDEIEPNSVLEENEKDVRQLHLDIILTPDFNVTSAQIEKLEELSSLCPLVDGNLVYWARAIYFYIDPHVLFLDDSICSFASQQIINSEENGIISTKLSLVPNPVNQNFEIFLDNISEIDLSLEIVDGLGRTVLIKKDLQSGRNHIDVYELADGIYSVILRQSAKTVGTSRMVKLSKK